METKICSKCGKELPLNQFEKDRNQCRDCRKAYRKERRKSHPEIHTAQALRRQQKQGEWLNSQKSACIICGESEPVCIDFHHINPEEKEFTISKHRNRSKEWLSIEITKCVCLCANCHRKVHAGLLNLNNFINKSSSCPTGESVTE